MGWKEGQNGGQIGVKNNPPKALERRLWIEGSERRTARRRAIIAKAALMADRNGGTAVGLAGCGA